MNEDKLTQRLAWFVPLRLVSYVILFFIVVLWMGFPSYLELPFVVYSLTTLALSSFIALKSNRNWRALMSTAVAVQFVAEIALESGVVFATGSVNSTFSALFILTIVSASLAYRLVGTLVMASLVSLAYTFIIWLGLGDAIDSGSGGGTLQIIFSVQDSVFYAIFLHMLIFYVVAFISGFLAERLSYRDVQLARASVELKQARLETDDILHHLNSGLLSVDSVGAIIYFNRAAERILGYQERDIKGLPCRMVFAQRMPHLADRLMETVSYRMEHPRRELEIVNVDGDTIPIGVSTSVLTDDAGGVRGVIAIFTDLTDAKKLEAKVRSADRLAAIGELSASIAHEIRNPLAAISGSVEVLQKELQLRGESGGLMDLIVKESHRLSRLLTDFLSFARVDSSSFEKVELGHVINDVMRILSHHQSFSSGIELRLETDEPTTYVIGDADLIKQLLLNLAVNSCEAFGERPGLLAFHIISSGDGGVVELVVQDDGPGMTRETMKQIFRPFYSTKKQGSGLGLAIVHRICTAIHADINVDSRSGAGTTFHILFRGYQTRRTLESSDHKARTPATT